MVNVHESQTFKNTFTCKRKTKHEMTSTWIRGNQIYSVISHSLRIQVPHKGSVTPGCWFNMDSLHSKRKMLNDSNSFEVRFKVN